MLHPIRRWLVAAMVSLLPGVVLADPSADRAEPADAPANGEDAVLNLNVSTSGYPPYLIHYDDGSYGGIVYDLVTRIAERLGYRVEPHEIPRKRLTSLMLEDHIDATPLAREWAEDPERFLFTDPMVSIREVFFTPADSDFRFEGLDELEDITLVTPLGYQYPDLEPLFANGTVERYQVSDDRDAFTYLLHGRGMDAVVADLAVGQWIIRQQGWQGEFRHSRKALSDHGYRLMLRPGWQSFAEAFNDELAKMKDNGELEAIRDRYR
ncbi:MAG: substrate-binding periplasmic protein [Marinobacter sp.]